MPLQQFYSVPPIVAADSTVLQIGRGMLSYWKHYYYQITKLSLKITTIFARSGISHISMARPYHYHVWLFIWQTSDPFYLMVIPHPKAWPQDRHSTQRNGSLTYIQYKLKINWVHCVPPTQMEIQLRSGFAVWITKLPISKKKTKKHPLGRLPCLSMFLKSAFILFFIKVETAWGKGIFLPVIRDANQCCPQPASVKNIWNQISHSSYCSFLESNDL